jgi:uncharacterized protein (TIGR03086 family)
MATAEAAMEAFAVHRDAVTVWTGRVSRIGGGDWDRPTPCGDWDVRELVRHVVVEELWTPPLMAGATLAEVGDRFDGDVLGADPPAAARRAAEDAAAATPEGGDEDRLVHLSAGLTPAREYAMQLAADHLVHGWDLAVAIGAERELPPDLVAGVAGWFVAREERYRSGGAIGERVPLADDASPQDRLLAAFGRDPAWTPPA